MMPLLVTTLETFMVMQLAEKANRTMMMSATADGESKTQA